MLRFWWKAGFSFSIRGLRAAATSLFVGIQLQWLDVRGDSFLPRGKAPQGQKLHSTSHSERATFANWKSATVLESAWPFHSLGRRKKRSPVGSPMSNRFWSEPLSLFINISYNSKNRGGLRCKGTGKGIAQNKKAFHDYFTKRNIRSRLPPSRTEISRFALDAINWKMRLHVT